MCNRRGAATTTAQDFQKTGGSRERRCRLLPGDKGEKRRFVQYIAQPRPREKGPPMVRQASPLEEPLAAAAAAQQCKATGPPSNRLVSSVPDSPRSQAPAKAATPKESRPKRSADGVDRKVWDVKQGALYHHQPQQRRAKINAEKEGEEEERGFAPKAKTGRKGRRSVAVVCCCCCCCVPSASFAVAQKLAQREDDKRSR
ncbi:hypothetical protein HPB50_003976 [Hyalomma asiaticum]|uniref:Uncharacterized protein n=1 Tax=Hyalomma asiaticum TaxID=266040 RepID=A0ACB7T7X7_HYAAI|nr:hypothetical protein HPB50_003976 [Hyalomma asiaticum]